MSEEKKQELKKYIKKKDIKKQNNLRIITINKIVF